MRHYDTRGILAFVDECCELDVRSLISARDLYTAWLAWRGLPPSFRSSPQHFGRLMNAAFPDLWISNMRMIDGRYRHYVGIRLKA